MSKINDGGPAYACTTWRRDMEGTGEAVPEEFFEGMSMRDEFAKDAMAGMWANPGTSCMKKEHAYGLAKTIAWTAYVMADAMLKQRNEETGASDVAPPTKPPIIT